MLNIKHTSGLGDVSALSHKGLRIGDVKQVFLPGQVSEMAAVTQVIRAVDRGAICFFFGFKSSAAAVKVYTTCTFK